jgi:hypothetical protein
LPLSQHVATRIELGLAVFSGAVILGVGVVESARGETLRPSGFIALFCLWLIWSGVHVLRRADQIRKDREGRARPADVSVTRAALQIARGLLPLVSIYLAATAGDLCLFGATIIVVGAILVAVNPDGLGLEKPSAR